MHSVEFISGELMAIINIFKVKQVNTLKGIFFKQRKSGVMISASEWSDDVGSCDLCQNNCWKGHPCIALAPDTQMFARESSLDELWMEGIQSTVSHVGAYALVARFAIKSVYLPETI